MMRRLLAALALCLAAAGADAACPPIPYVFTPGTPYNATQINANFTSVRNCVSTADPIQAVTNTQAVRDLAPGAYSFVQRAYNVTPGDGAAIYYWSASSTCTDNGQTCIRPSTNPVAGRWVVSSQVAENMYLNPLGSVGSIGMMPQNQTSTAISYETAATGTVVSTPTDAAAMALTWLRQEGALKGMGVNHQIAMFEADYVDTTTGANNDDTYNGVIGNCNITGTKTGGGTPGTSCVGITAAARGLAPQGGTPGSESGGIHGINVVSGLTDLGTTPTNYNNAIGGEADLIGCTGCTLKVRWGWGAIDFGDGLSGATSIEHGSSVDAAFVIGSLSGPNYGWNYGIDFVGTPIYNGNGLVATGTVLGSSSTTPIVADYGIDLSNFVINQAVIRGPGSNFVVTGAGDIQAAMSINSLGGGISIDAAAADPAVLQWRSATTPKWELTREAMTADLILSNLAAATIDMRVTAAGLVKFGNSGSMVVDTTGGVQMPGGGLAVGNAVTGGLKGDGTINVKTALYINNVIGVTCGPGAPTAAFHVVGGIVIAC